MGQFRPLFRLFSTIQIEKSLDGALGIRTQSRRMVGKKNTELWRPLCSPKDYTTTGLLGSNPVSGNFNRKEKMTLENIKPTSFHWDFKLQALLFCQVAFPPALTGCRAEDTNCKNEDVPSLFFLSRSKRHRHPFPTKGRS